MAPKMGPIINPREKAIPTKALKKIIRINFSISNFFNLFLVN